MILIVSLVNIHKSLESIGSCFCTQIHNIGSGSWTWSAISQSCPQNAKSTPHFSTVRVKCLEWPQIYHFTTNI